jgi:single-strand DNA-binding protein
MNKVCLIGNIGALPEIRSMQNGNRVAQFSVATSKSWTDKQTGERKQATEWHRVVVFNDHLVGVIDGYLTKGSKIYLEGELRTRQWKDKTGEKRYTTEVVLEAFGGLITMLDPKPNDDTAAVSENGSLERDLDNEMDLQ